MITIATGNMRATSATVFGSRRDTPSSPPCLPATRQPEYVATASADAARRDQLLADIDAHWAELAELARELEDLDEQAPRCDAPPMHGRARRQRPPCAGDVFERCCSACGATLARCRTHGGIRAATHAIAQHRAACALLGQAREGAFLSTAPGSTARPFVDTASSSLKGWKPFKEEGAHPIRGER